MKKLLLLALFISQLTFAQTQWVAVPNKTFSYASSYYTYGNTKTSPKNVASIMLDLRWNEQRSNGEYGYFRGLIDCTQLQYTQDPKAIDYFFGKSVSVSPYERDTWWEPIHPDHWAYPLMKYQCGRALK